MDLFCGTGSIGLTLAKDCHHVYGFESTASSVVDARRNAEVNGISNATFVHGDLTKVAAMMGKQYPNPDVIVTGGLFCE
jgi:tRNA/tmRNA/rRNA uracil-C5-methylase (TrmA/RlmC/RlmD family)